MSRRLLAVTGAAAIALVASALGVPVDQAASAPPTPGSGRLALTGAQDGLRAAVRVEGPGSGESTADGGQWIAATLLDGADHIGEANSPADPDLPVFALVATKNLVAGDEGIEVDPDSAEDANGDAWLAWYEFGDGGSEYRVARVTGTDDDVPPAVTPQHPAVDIVAGNCLRGVLVVDVAYASRQTGDWDIYVARLSSERTGTCADLEIVDRQRVSEDPADDTWPAWGRTRDGGRVLVYRSTRLDPLGDLFRVDLPWSTSGELGFTTPLDGDAVRMTDHPGDDSQPAVRTSSPEVPQVCAVDPVDEGGRAEPTWVAYRTDEFDPRGGIAVLPLDAEAGDPPLDVGARAASEPAWSPSGDYLAYRTTEEDPDGDIFYGRFVRRCLDADVYASPRIAGVTGDGYEGDVLSLNVEVGNLGLLDAEDVRLTIDVEGSADPTGPLPSGCFIDEGGSIRCDIGLVTAEDLTVIGPALFTLTGPGLAEFTATVTTTTREIELANNTERVSYTVPEPEPLEVEIVDVQYAPDFPGGPYPGDTVSATVRVRNTGPPAADDVWVGITYSGATPLGALPPGCAADEPTSTIACDLGDLDGLNPTSLPLTFVAGPPGSLELTATASAPAKGPPATATVTLTIAARPEVDLRVTNAYTDSDGSGTGRVLARVVEVTGSGGAEVSLPVGTPVVVSTWTTGTRPITLFGGTSCAGSPDDPSPCPPRTLPINSYTFVSLEIESGVAVPYELVDGGGDADVFVRVDPVPPAVDPNPSNDDNRKDTCVAGCIELADGVVQAAVDLATRLADSITLVAGLVLQDPSDEIGSVASLATVRPVLGEPDLAESHPTWVNERFMIATARATAADVEDVDADDGSGRGAVADDPIPREAHPSYSRDGRFVAFHRTTCDEVGGEGDCDRPGSEIVVARSDGTEAATVYGGVPRPEGAVDTNPAWSPDGTSIAFTRIVPLGDDLEADPNARTEIWVARGLDLGSEPPALTATEIEQATTPTRATSPDLDLFSPVDEFDDEAAWLDSDPNGTGDERIVFTRSRCYAFVDPEPLVVVPSCATPPPTPPPAAPLPEGPAVVVLRPLDPDLLPRPGQYDSDIWLVQPPDGASPQVEEPLLEVEVAAPDDYADPGAPCAESDDVVCLGGDDRGADVSPDGELVVYEHAGWLWLADVSDLDGRVDAGPITGPRALTDPPYNAPEQPLYPDDPLDPPPTDPDDPAGEYYPDLEWAQDPSWSPNGDRIAFAGQPRGRPDDRGIYWLTHVPDDPDSREIREIAQLRQPELEPDWQPTADLAVTLTAVPTAVEVGDGATLTADVVNEGPATALSSVVELTLPSGLTAGTLPADCASGTPITCDLDDLDEGATVSLAFPVTGASAGTATSTVEVASDTVDPDPADNSDSATVAVTQQPPVVPQADVSVTIAVDPPIAYWRKPQTLTVTTTNGGSVASTVTLRVSVPAQSGPPSADPCLTATGCSLGSVAAKGTAVTTIPLLAADAFAGTATATVAGSVDDLNLDNNSASTALEMRRPTLRLVPPLGHPGFVTLALGETFPPGSDVRLRWQPGLNASRDALPVEADGEFRTAVIVLHRDQLGVREISVTSETDLFDEVVVEFLVTPRTQSPPDFEGRG